MGALFAFRRSRVTWILPIPMCFDPELQKFTKLNVTHFHTTSLQVMAYAGTIGVQNPGPSDSKHNTDLLRGARVDMNLRLSLTPIRMTTQSEKVRDQGANENIPVTYTNWNSSIIWTHRS